MFIYFQPWVLHLAIVNYFAFKSFLNGAICSSCLSFPLQSHNWSGIWRLHGARLSGWTFFKKKSQLVGKKPFPLVKLVILIWHDKWVFPEWLQSNQTVTNGLLIAICFHFTEFFHSLRKIKRLLMVFEHCWKWTTWNGQS